MKIKTGDKVKVLSGKDKGKIGKVIQVLFNKKNYRHFVVVEGANVLKKHLKSSGRKSGEKGQIIELSSPMDISNVMLIDPKTDKAVRVGFTIEGDEKQKNRVSKKSGELIDR